MASTRSREPNLAATLLRYMPATFRIAASDKLNPNKLWHSLLECKAK